MEILIPLCIIVGLFAGFIIGRLTAKFPAPEDGDTTNRGGGRPEE